VSLVGRGSCAVPRHRLHKWPRHGLQPGSDELRGRSPDLCISAPGRRAARMPGTGPQRRSSAAARMKALVRKSRFRAALLRSPQRYFFPPNLPSTRCCGFGICALFFGTPPSLFLSTGKANGVGGSSWFQQTDQELIPKDFKFSRCNGL
jgi:hypothetical protein